jgi:hypothetical protein
MLPGNALIYFWFPMLLQLTALLVCLCRGHIIYTPVRPPVIVRVDGTTDYILCLLTILKLPFKVLVILEYAIDSFCDSVLVGGAVFSHTDCHTLIA